MLARTALARLRAKVSGAAARDVARLSRQLRTTLATTIATANNATATAPLSIAQFQRIRGYATAAATKTKTRASKATKKAPAKKATATKKTKAPAKKTTATKKKAAAKPKKAAAKPVKKALTPLQVERLEKRKLAAAAKKERDHIKQLKETALKEPKRKPAGPFQILMMEILQKEGNTKGIPELAKVASQRYKNLSTPELERLNRISKEADEENKKAYKKWVESHTPLEIRHANNARRLLKTKLASFPKPQIHDDRAVTGPKTPYIFFFTERMTSGDFKGISIVEGATQIGKEWKALSPSDRKKYEDAAAESKENYCREFKKVYGYEPVSVQRAAAVAA